ncbi:hypothetical protein CFK37_01005 [Virgibacillus phasianinus]|uniref:DUF1259 domain-containing protein n=1 Tax=Virgibacillus phasianinus TaxID=2017483 RepID=A0A220TYU6_9BACI|nr:DUF1259 domain-containing protein [Virgibacillus phasianinus]ASK60886.1 hypothetical protein CFK37_01005 [Virgibacillus phasianinus]
MGNMVTGPSPLCKEFARILGCIPQVVNDVCLATRSRTNIHPKVLGRKAESAMFLPQVFSFEHIDREGKALCLGETVILQEEINPFMRKLQDHGIIVTAVHNHWLFDKPRLMYMHFESIDNPLSFATKTRDAMNVLITGNVNDGTRHDLSIKNSRVNITNGRGQGVSSPCDQLGAPYAPFLMFTVLFRNFSSLLSMSCPAPSLSV